MSKALVLMDLQSDYFPGGRMELVGATAAVERAAGLLAAFRGRSLPVIHIQHLATRAGATRSLAPWLAKARAFTRTVPAKPPKAKATRKSTAAAKSKAPR